MIKTNLKFLGSIGVPEFKCPFCDRTYGFECNWRAHIREQHQGWSSRNENIRVSQIAGKNFTLKLPWNHYKLLLYLCIFRENEIQIQFQDLQLQGLVYQQLMEVPQHQLLVIRIHQEVLPQEHQIMITIILWVQERHLLRPQRLPLRLIMQIEAAVIQIPIWII